jgi:small-conductance mechanosensitive channel
MIHRWVLRLALCLLIPFAAFAQSNTDINYDLWKSVANRAETAVDSEAGTNDVFETLRSRIVDFRSKFAAARLLNKERIGTLQAQLTALGPIPESGEEPATVSAQREQITKQLATLQAPIQVAESAYKRADGLIGEIDKIIRERQTSQLLSLGPSPLNPISWGNAISGFSKIFSNIVAEKRLFSDPEARGIFKSSAPLVLLLLAFATLLVARGRRWVVALGNYLRSFGGRGSGVWGFVLSLFRMVVPLIGIVALSAALQLTGMLGLRGERLVEALPFWAATLFSAHWLSEWLFPRNDEDPLIPISATMRRRVRIDISLLSLMIVLRNLLDTIISFGVNSAGVNSTGVIQAGVNLDGINQVSTMHILSFPLVVIVGCLLFRIGNVLRSASEVSTPESSEERVTTFSRIMRLIGLTTIVVAFVGPVMAAIGYGQAGDALVFPTVYSLAVLGLVLVLQRFFADVYGLISGQGVAAREALVPVLIGIAILLITTPVLALIWGARTADLTEAWSAFSQGFTIGDSRISPGDFITFAVIFSVGYMITRLLQGALRNNVLPKTRMDKGGQNAIVSGLGYVGIFLAALMAITGAGIDLSSLAIVAGALSVGIGFGLQNIVSNFVSGIILLIERPISEGDWIEVGGQQGYVRAISVRSTRIETFDRTDVIVPNADLVSGTVTNFTRGNTVGRLIMPVGVAYGTDTMKVDGILREIAEAQPMVLADPAPVILFSGFGADSLDFEIRMILRDVNWTNHVKNAVNHQIMAKFTEEGIEIPFAQRDVWLRNPEALKGDA